MVTFDLECGLRGMMNAVRISLTNKDVQIIINNKKNEHLRIESKL